MKSFFAVFCALLAAFVVKGGVQFYGCKAGKFSDDYCVYAVLAK